MKAFYRDDTDKGPGFGFLDISDVQFENLEGLRFSIKRGTDQNSLGAGGWRPSENPLSAQTVTLTDDGFAFAVGPEVVDYLDTLENYRITLVYPDGSTAAGSLRVPEVTYSPIDGGQGLATPLEPIAPPPPPPPPPPPVEPPAPEPEPHPEPEPQPAPEPEPAPEPIADILPPPAKQPAARKNPMVPAILLILLLALVGGGLAAWKLLPEEDKQPVATEDKSPDAADAKPPVAAENKSPDAADGKAPPKEEGKAPSRPALAQAREHLAGKADPGESTALAEKLREQPDGADAAFLLVEDAAQKGDPKAMLLTGGYFDPADSAPSGSILKDPAEALSWYKKAKAAGNPAADARLASLRAWAELEAGKGSPEAKLLLKRF